MTICPYKLVLLGITVVFAALVAVYSGPESIDDVDEDEDDKYLKEKLRERRQRRSRDGGSFGTDEMHAKLGSGRVSSWESATTWMDYRPDWVIRFKICRPQLYRTLYLSCVVMLVVFHLEIFSGGWMCRQLFAPSPNITATLDLQSH